MKGKGVSTYEWNRVREGVEKLVVCRDTGHNEMKGRGKIKASRKEIRKSMRVRVPKKEEKKKR